MDELHPKGTSSKGTASQRSCILKKLHPKELHPKGIASQRNCIPKKLHPDLLWILSMSLCGQHTHFQKGIFASKPSDTSFSENAWLLASLPVDLPLSSPPCQQLPIAMGLSPHYLDWRHTGGSAGWTVLLRADWELWWVLLPTSAEHRRAPLHLHM